MKKQPSARLWSTLALAFVLTALLFAFRSGDTLLLFPRGSAEETADAFFAALESGDYAGASGLCLPALPKEERPGEADAALVYDALRESLRWQREGEGERRGSRAVVRGSLTVLDPAALTRGMKDEVNAILAQRVSQARLSSEVYNEDGSYREAVVMEAWNSALAARLEQADTYYITLPLTLSLEYTGGQWHLEANEALISALSGGLA